MAIELPISVKTGSLLLGVVGAAIGLNLTVMGLGAQQPVVDQTAPQPLTQTVPDGEPEVRLVSVDVPVPTISTAPGTIGTIAAPAKTTSSTATKEPSPIAAAKLTTAATSTTGAPTTATSTTGAPTATAPTTATPSTAAPTPSPAPTSPSSTEYLSYTFEGVAEIVVAYHNGQSLEFWSATPQSGWTYQVEKNTAAQIEIKFRRSNGDDEAKFQLVRENGKLDVRTER